MADDNALENDLGITIGVLEGTRLVRGFDRVSFSYGYKEAMRIRFSYDEFEFLRAKPGTYAVEQLHHREGWALCLSEGTLKFDVQPGKVNFLGILQSEALGDRLTLRTLQGMDFYKSEYQQREYYHGNFPPLVFSKPTEADIEKLRVELERSYPGSNAEIVITDLVPTRFDRDEGLAGTGYNKRCGD